MFANGESLGFRDCHFRCHRSSNFAELLTSLPLLPSVQKSVFAAFVVLLYGTLFGQHAVKRMIPFDLEQPIIFRQTVRLGNRADFDEIAGPAHG